MTTKTFIIGRNPNVSQGEIPITVNDPSKKVSSNHCRITYDGDNFFIEDLISTNGTFVDRERINNRRLVTRDNTITLGPQFVFSLQHPIISENIYGSSEKNETFPVAIHAELPIEGVDMTVGSIIQKGAAIGFENAGTIIISYLLWLITFWIPYINIGTTIGIVTLPVGLSKGKVMSATEIFDSKYRRYFGSFILLLLFVGIGTNIALLFMIIPALILSLAWSQSFNLLVDKKLNAMECLRTSNNMTYGYKTNMFLSFIAMYLLMFVIGGIVLGGVFYLTQQIGGTGFIISIIFYIIFAFSFILIAIGMNAYIYQQLSKRLL